MESAKKILTLGCGDNPVPGAINTDLIPPHPGIIKLDMNSIPYPFKDNEFDEVQALQVISFICPLKFVSLIEELYRILKPNGKLIVDHMYRLDPFTRTHLSKNSFAFFDGQFYRNHTKARFKLIKYKKKILWTHLRRIHIPIQRWILQAIK